MNKIHFKTTLDLERLGLGAVFWAGGFQKFNPNGSTLRNNRYRSNDG